MDVARCVCGYLFEPHEPNDPQLAAELAARAAQAAGAAEAAAQTTAVEPENTLKATEAARARIGREYLAVRAAQTAEEAKAVIQRAAREPENKRKMAQALKVQRVAIASEIVLDEPCAGPANAGCQSNPDPARAVQGGASDVPTRIERRMSAASPVKAFIMDRVANVMKMAALQTLRETIVVAHGTKPKKSFIANQVIKVMKTTAAPTGKNMPDTQSTKPGKRFRANQAAKALKALKTTLSVETKRCSSCGTTLEASASRCSCGYAFRIPVPEIVPLRLSPDERANVRGISKTKKA